MTDIFISADDWYVPASRASVFREVNDFTPPKPSSQVCQDVFDCLAEGSEVIASHSSVVPFTPEGDRKDIGCLHRITGQLLAHQNGPKPA